MTDRRHSLKRGDRLSKKERQTTASDRKKATNCDKFVLWVKSDSDIYYNQTIKRQSSYKMSDKQPGLHLWWASILYEPGSPGTSPEEDELFLCS